MVERNEGNPTTREQRQELRQWVEQFLRLSDRSIQSLPTEDMQRLVHELQVYQIELEMQNEELRRGQQGWLLTPQHLPATPDSWRHDLYAYRRETIELLFQRLIQTCDLKACPTKGLARNGPFVIASVWLYQILFLSNYRQHRPLTHIKEIMMKPGGVSLPELCAGFT